MENVATKTQSARTPKAPKAPRLPLTGTNDAVDATISAAQALFDAYPQQSAGHTAAEAASDAAKDDPRIQRAWERCDRRFQRIIERLDAASDAILKPEVRSLAEAQTRLHAYVVAQALQGLPFKRWRNWTLDAAIKAARRAMWNEDGLTKALAVFAADVAKVTAEPPSGPPPAPGGVIRAAADCYLRLEERFAHSTTNSERHALSEAQQPHIDAVLANRAVTLADLIAKAEVAETYQPAPDHDEHGDLQWRLHRSLTDDLLALKNTPHPDAELLALGAEFERRWAEQRAYPIEAGDGGYDALTARTDEVSERIRRIRATTIEGLRVKARVVLECQSDEQDVPVEFTDGGRLCDTGVAASIVNDLLGLAERPIEERKAEAEQVRAQLSRHREMRRPADMNGPVARSWYAARDAYFAAQAASDAFHDAELDRADPSGSDAALDAVAAAMERWESLPPPSLEALAEVMLASLRFNGFSEVRQTDHLAKGFRDLLDGSMTHEIFAARFTLHALRLAGQAPELLTVVPIAGLYPDHADAFDDADWYSRHVNAEPHATRWPELVEWWRAVQADPDQRGRQTVTGRHNVRAVYEAAAEPVCEDVIAAAPDYERGPEALRLARAI